MERIILIALSSLERNCECQYGFGCMWSPPKQECVDDSLVSCFLNSAVQIGVYRYHMFFTSRYAEA